ncbi:MAG: hypothetical protein AAFR57_10805 [Pseudomonadota bacterium]
MTRRGALLMLTLAGCVAPVAPPQGDARLVKLPGAAVVQIVVDSERYAALNDAIAEALAEVLGPPANALEQFEAPVTFLLSGSARPSSPDQDLIVVDWVVATVTEGEIDRYRITARPGGGLFRSITEDDLRGVGWLSADEFIRRPGVQERLRPRR